MAGFDPDEWHQTTEADMQHRALGGGDYEYAVWETLQSPLYSPRQQRLDQLAAAQKIVTDKAHALAQQRGMIPYTPETFETLMTEVELSARLVS